MNTKVCTRCLEDKPLSSFTRQKRGLHGLKSRCSVCCNFDSKEWRDKNPEKFRDMRRRYFQTSWGRSKQIVLTSRKNAAKGGYKPVELTAEQIIQSMTGACAVCGRLDGEGRNRLCLDHDHATGRFRGWLCTACNGAIGLLGDNSSLLRKAAEYLNDRS